MPFFLGYSRKHFGQIGRHTVPREMNTCMVFQVPVDTSSNTYIVISPHDHLIAFLVEFKEIHIGLLLLNDELLGSSLVDTFQQAGDGISGEGGYAP